LIHHANRQNALPRFGRHSFLHRWSIWVGGQVTILPEKTQPRPSSWGVFRRHPPRILSAARIRCSSAIGLGYRIPRCIRRTRAGVSLREANARQSVSPWLEHLIKYSRRKIFLILDNLKVHHARKVTEWVKRNNARIELFFRPAYGPDLKPDEHLNADLKHGVGTRAPSRMKKQLFVAAQEHLLMLKNSPKRIQKYFEDPVIAYAAT